jgi:L-ascorbate metabolism protein UlaG (beta-lactamase superfamily)
MIHSYTKNPDLKTIKANWPGTPLDEKGRFMNHINQNKLEFKNIIKWQSSKNPDRIAKKNDNFSLVINRNDDFLNSSKDCIVWLGHASFFMRLNGKTILIDPIFKSPSITMKRFSALPVPVSDFKNIDYILLSHDHRDHADEPSMKILAKQNPNTQYLTGLKLDILLKKWTKSTKIQAAGWYQQFETEAGLEIYYIPSRHWGRRYLTDTNERLWGGFILKTAQKTIYFGGDSGYGGHFKEIGETFENIDIAMLGIGAYKPEWFMHESHTSPADAVRAFHDVKAKTLIPMHYGTFDLSDEALGDPPSSIQKLKDEGVLKGDLQFLEIGEMFSWH